MTYLLIPGGWHGAWSWRPVAERIRAAGHRAISLTLPGLGDGDDPTGIRLTDASEYIVEHVRQLDLDHVIVVAHSWGGYPATDAAPRLGGRLTKIVYYNAQVPVCGESLADDVPPEIRDKWLRQIAESPSGAIPLTLDEVEQTFMQGAAPPLQQLVADLLTPQPGRYFLDKVNVDPGTLEISTTYVASADDRAIQWPATEFATRLGTTPIVVPGTHESLLTHPDDVANAILSA
jgi:pimeloyl-ACP methyl ester carboxylesterase